MLLSYGSVSVNPRPSCADLRRPDEWTSSIKDWGDHTLRSRAHAALSFTFIWAFISIRANRGLVFLTGLPPWLERSRSAPSIISNELLNGMVRLNRSIEIRDDAGRHHRCCASTTRFGLSLRTIEFDRQRGAIHNVRDRTVHCDPIISVYLGS